MSFKRFIKIFQALQAEEVQYILIGGLAVVLHGFPRFTQDIDLMLSLVPGNIEKFRKALQSIYSDEALLEITPAELLKYSVIRYGTPDGFHIDIMAKLGEVAIYDQLDFQEIQLSGCLIRVITPEKLLQLKSGSLRPKDQQDVYFLRELLKKKKGGE